MARLVVPAGGMGRLKAPDLRDTPPDDYKSRLLKYIPAESIAFYTFADKFLISYYGLDPSGAATLRPADPTLFAVSWGLIILGLVGTPLYLWRQRLPGQPWQLHAALSTIAFLCWAYTLSGSVFVLHGAFNTLVAGLAAPVFTFVAGIFAPKPEAQS